MARSTGDAYNRIIGHIWDDHFKKGMTEFEFARREIVRAKELVASELDLNPVIAHDRGCTIADVRIILAS